MNKYYDNKNEYISNNRIFEAYFTEVDYVRSPFKKLLDTLLSVLISILAALTSERAKAILRVSTIALCLVGFVGTVGAVERGTLSMGFALLIGLVLVSIEIMCLKKYVR